MSLKFQPSIGAIQTDLICLGDSDTKLASSDSNMGLPIASLGNCTVSWVMHFLCRPFLVQTID